MEESVLEQPEKDRKNIEAVQKKYEEQDSDLKSVQEAYALKLAAIDNELDTLVSQKEIHDETEKDLEALMREKQYILNERSMLPAKRNIFQKIASLFESKEMRAQKDLSYTLSLEATKISRVNEGIASSKNRLHNLSALNDKLYAVRIETLLGERKKILGQLSALQDENNVSLN